MTPTIIPTTPPLGYRFMLAHEAERLDYAHPLVIWNGELNHAVVTRCDDSAITVMLRSGATVVLDLDDPDYWPDGEVRDRRPPMSPDGEFVALWAESVAGDADEEIEPLLRTSVALATMMKDDVELRAAVAEVRRIVTSRLRERAA